MSQTTVPNPTRVDEIADGIYRLATAIDLPDGPDAFSFNQYLIYDDELLLFHTGPRKLCGRVRRAQRLPRCGAARRARLRPDRGDGLGQRLCRPAATCARGLSDAQAIAPE